MKLFKAKGLEEFKTTYFFLLMILFPVLDTVYSIANFFKLSVNLAPISIISLLIYGGAKILKNFLEKKGIVILMLVYFLYIVLFLLSDYKVNQKFFEVGMILIYIFYWPISIFIISKIRSWNLFFEDKIKLRIADIIIILSLISKLYFSNSTNYMQYSYGLLPIWGFVVVSYIYYKRKEQILIMPLILYQAVVLGCRGALVSILLTIFLIYIFKNYYQIKNKMKYLYSGVYISICALIFYLNIDNIILYIRTSKLTRSSYILKRIATGTLSQGSGRSELIEIGLKEIKNMDLTKINGLFFDQLILPDGMYVHNFILETLISLGWFFGVLFLSYLSYLVIVSFFTQNKEGKIFLIYFITTYFIRYFISGSIYGEPNFIIFLSILISFKKKKVMRGEK